MTKQGSIEGDETHILDLADGQKEAIEWIFRFRSRIGLGQDVWRRDVHQRDRESRERARPLVEGAGQGKFALAILDRDLP